MPLNTLVFVLETLALTAWHFLFTTCKKISAALCQGNTVCDIIASMVNNWPKQAILIYLFISLAMQTHLKISKIPAGPWDIWLAFSLGMKVYETPLVNLESVRITKKTFKHVLEVSANRSRHFIICDQILEIQPSGCIWHMKYLALKSSN